MILIFGCGILGRHLLRALPEGERVLAVSTHDVCGVPGVRADVSFLRCDVRARDDLARLAEICCGEPLTVFYFAAMHNIDAVFCDSEAARRVNIDGLRDFFDCGLNVRKLLFASTDCVYGENDPDYPLFPEDAPLRPVNEYGRQKSAAEEIVRAHGFTVTRLPFMVGTSLCDKPNFYDNSVRRLQNGEEIEMIDGMARSALGYPSAARLLLRLSQTALPPGETVNVCGDRGYSKYEIGCLLAEQAGAPLSLVRKITMQQGQRFFKDRRADNALMDNTKLKRLLGVNEIPLGGLTC